jgi:hypothetical protein
MLPRGLTGAGTQCVEVRVRLRGLTISHGGVPESGAVAVSDAVNAGRSLLDHVVMRRSPAAVLDALVPEWESRFTASACGFRSGGGRHDAIYATSEGDAPSGEVLDAELTASDGILQVPSTPSPTTTCQLVAFPETRLFFAASSDVPRPLQVQRTCTPWAMELEHQPALLTLNLPRRAEWSLGCWTRA